MLELKNLIDSSKLTTEEKHVLANLYAFAIHYFNCSNTFFLFSEDKQESKQELQTLITIKNNVKKELNKLNKELFKNKKELYYD